MPILSSAPTRRSFLAGAATALATVALPMRTFGSDGETRLLPDWKMAGVVDTRHSPHAKLRSIPVRAVRIEDGFWSKRRATNVRSSIPSMREELLTHGRLDNFLRLENASPAAQRGPVYSDSDLYKWTEAVGYVLQSEPAPALRRQTDTMIRQMVAAQEPTGYLNTYFVGEHKPLRMQPKTQETGHELYCIGHLLQAGLAYYRATGDPALANAGIRFVDDFLLPGYGPAASQAPIVAGHPEIEMSLVELYRATGNRKYLDLAGYILNGDARIPLRADRVVYMFCGVPFTSRQKLEGHAVRAMYACCGATDYYLETGDPAYWTALNRLWEDLSAHQLYITGGVGARSDGEAFGEAYELPNATAYGESCAAIGNMMWNWRMLSATGDAKFTDVLERALYNGINSGMSLDGKMYCYRNPLAYDPAGGDKIRNPWYDTTCCPPNLERTLAALPGYFYSTAAEGVYVHLYDNSEIDWRLASGNAFKIRQQTGYPWDGAVRLTITPAVAEEFTVFVRIPGWSKSNRVLVNDTAITEPAAGQYLPIRRRWAAGDRIELQFDMQPQIVHAHPSVNDDRGRIAFQRGPLVYCMEQLDQQHASEDPSAPRIPGMTRYVALLVDKTEASTQPQLLDGVTTLDHPGALLPEPSPSLYVAGTPKHTAGEPVQLRMIPYYAWCNRAATSMQVWIPYQAAPHEVA